MVCIILLLCPKKHYPWEQQVIYSGTSINGRSIQRTPTIKRTTPMHGHATPLVRVHNNLHLTSTSILRIQRTVTASLTVLTYYTGQRGVARTREGSGVWERDYTCSTLRAIRTCTRRTREFARVRVVPCRQRPSPWRAPLRKEFAYL